MFDYAILNRPIVIYANDWETYVNCRGVYVDILKDSPGLVAAAEGELVEAFRSGAVWGPEASAARARFRQRFCEFDDGMAAERVVRRVFLGEIIAPVTGAAARVPSGGASGPSHEPGEKAATQPMPAHSGEGSARETKVTT